jgi:uncharacterized protein (TIGR00369 family)
VTGLVNFNVGGFLLSDLLTLARFIIASQPFSVLLGTQVHAYGDDAVELHLPLSDNLKQQHGFGHGGVLAYLADNALTMAAGLSMGGGVLTTEMKINYLRPAVGELLIARAKTLSAGRMQGVSRCDIFAVKDGIEKLCAAAQGTVTKAQGKAAEVPATTQTTQGAAQ